MKSVKILKEKALSILLLLIVMSVFLVGCGTEQKTQVAPSASAQAMEGNGESFHVTITDTTGAEIELIKKPERIISLAPNITEILAALGLEDKMVGRTTYCNYPSSITALPEVGDAYTPNIEMIVDLNPDLVIGATHVSKEMINKLREVGVKVVFLDESINFEDTYSLIEKIGTLTGTEEKATEVVSRMKEKVASVEAEVKALNLTQPPKVYFANDIGEIDYCATGDTFIGEMLRLAGATNIAEEMTHWSISKEQIAEGDPDLIIVPSDSNIAEKIGSTAFYKDLRAVKEGKVFEIDGDSISRQSPRVADALVELAHIIHPELGNK